MEVLAGGRRHTPGHQTGSSIKHRTTRWDVRGHYGRQHPTGLLTGENPWRGRGGDRAETDGSIKKKPPRLSKIKGTVFTQAAHSANRKAKLTTTSTIQQASVVMPSDNDRMHNR